MSQKEKGRVVSEQKTYKEYKARHREEDVSYWVWKTQKKYTQCGLCSGAQDMGLLYISDDSEIFLYSHPSQKYCRQSMLIVVSRGDMPVGVAELIIALLDPSPFG